jgi:hypothetical protein
MFRRKRPLILIPTLLLIPLLVGMIPLKLAHKLAHKGTCTQCQDKNGCGLKNCFTHSLISQNHFEGVTDHSTSPNQVLFYVQHALPVGPESLQSGIFLTSTPLRC